MASFRRSQQLRPSGRCGTPSRCPRRRADAVPARGGHIGLHLVRTNPLFAARGRDPACLLSVAGDWAFIPSSWKAIGDEDPRLGIPTTYYGAVQFAGTATVHDEREVPGSVSAVLRRQLQAPCNRRFRSPTPRWRIPGTCCSILGISIAIDDGVGQVQIRRQCRRGSSPRRGRPPAPPNGPGDAAAAGHVMRRLGRAPRSVKEARDEWLASAGPWPCSSATPGLLLGRSSQVGQSGRHFGFGMRRIVVAQHATRDLDEGRAVVLPRLGDPASLWTRLELIAPVGDGRPSPW